MFSSPITSPIQGPFCGLSHGGFSTTPGSKVNQAIDTSISSRRWKYTGLDGNMTWTGTATISNNGAAATGSPLAVVLGDRLIVYLGSSAQYDTAVYVDLAVTGWVGTRFTVTTMSEPQVHFDELTEEQFNALTEEEFNALVE